METTFLKKLGSIVRKYRVIKNLSQEKLAFAADISSDYLGKIELGKVNPSIFVIYKLAKALGIKTADLIKEL